MGNEDSFGKVVKNELGKIFRCFLSEYGETV
jgi:hypothetical protein